MRAPLVALLTALPALLLAGCSDEDRLTGEVTGGVRVVEIHVGWSDDHQSQYMHPDTIRVREGDKVRFVVTNDDDPDVDYNGAKSGRDNFHDLALLDYDGDGDGIDEDIEHEVPAGQTVATELNGKAYFIAAEMGTFRIICEVRTVPSHDALGMHAEFIVE